MRKLAWALGLALVIVTACMVYLLFHGIALRSAPLIKPSVLRPDFANAAHDVVLRLYPDFASAHYVLLGLEPLDDERRSFLIALQREGGELLGRPVNLREGAAGLSREELAACPAPCWLVLPADGANELRENSFIAGKLLTLGRAYMNITWIDFRRGEPVSAACDRERRLDLECLGPVGVREVARKLKDTSARHYFMRKYNERDHFLFIERPTP